MYAVVQFRKNSRAREHQKAGGKGRALSLALNTLLRMPETHSRVPVPAPDPSFLLTKTLAGSRLWLK